MIRKLTGEVVDVTEQTIVVDVQEVGYLIYVVAGHHYRSGSTVELWTHLAVRETALDLYGFPTRDELAFFELLLTLPKIGPKSALQILAQADLTLIKECVIEQDAKKLTKLSGIGKKTAEKIVLELKDKFEYTMSDVAGDASVGGQAMPEHLVNVVDTLTALGYNQQEARDAARAIPPDITNTSDAVKFALKLLS